MSVPSSGYQLAGDILQRKNPTPAASPLSGRDFESVDSGVTAFKTTVRDHDIYGKAAARFVMANGTARASELFRRRKAASLRLGLGEIEGGEAAGRHCQCSTCVRPALSRYPQRTSTGHTCTFESVKSNQLLSKWFHAGGVRRAGGRKQR